MPLPTNFWTTGWNNVRCIPDFSGATIVDSVSSGHRLVEITNAVDVVLAAGDYSDTKGKGFQSKNTGIFYGKKVASPDDVLVFRYAATWGWLPHDPQAPIGGTFPLPNWYYPPFIGMSIKFGGDSDDGSGGVRSDPSRLQTTAPDGAVAYDLFHWQPLTFIGTIAEVIGAIFCYHGVDADKYIDKQSFDDAFDGQIASGSEISERPFIWYRVEIGETVSDAIKNIMDHCSDFLTVNSAGKLAMVSRYYPPESTIPINQSDVIGKTEIKFPLDIITNKIFASHGQWCCFLKSNYSGYDPAFRADLTNEYFVDGSIPESIEIFGERNLKGKTREVVVDNVLIKKRSTGFPYFYFTTQKTFFIDRMELFEGFRRALVTVEQGLLGLDFDIGYKLNDVDIFDQDVAFSDMRCIKREIDFNTMKIKSTLLEEVETQPPAPEPPVIFISQFVYSGTVWIHSMVLHIPGLGHNKVRLSWWLMTDRGFRFRARIRWRKAGASSWNSEPWGKYTWIKVWTKDVKVPPGQRPRFYEAQIKGQDLDEFDNPIPGTKTAWVDMPELIVE